MRAHPRGANAAIIGEVTSAHPGMLVARTAIGAQRVIAMQIGEQLPRIC
jgi:hydrogenase expression/formation protein HypE